LETSIEKARNHMKQHGNISFEERRKAATEAKQKLLKKFEAAPKPDDPEMVAKRAERQALAEARETRRAERRRQKQEEAERLKAEAAAREAAEAKAKADAIAEAEAIATAEAEAREAGKKKLIERVIADEAERKAERDRRYAARKARQK
jgi:hypothetical protein